MTTVCASCGIAEVDEIKLKECGGCDLVRYCSDECREEHKLEHEEECKQRAAELREELLFKQPESSHFGECPICCIPLPLDIRKSPINECCSKVICNGCSHANKMRAYEKRLEYSCPFCREPMSSTDDEHDKRRMKRVEANDPVSIHQEGVIQYKRGEYIKAFEYWTKAADLGDAEAHYKLALSYHHGHGVEKNKGKKIYHLEEAAIGGHPHARYSLGRYEWNYGNLERAVKHWIIAATQGQDESVKNLMNAFKGGFVEKANLDSALRAYQAAVDATKSPQREAAEAYYKNSNSVG